MDATNMVGLHKCLVDIAAAFRRDVANVAVQFLARQRSAGFDGFFSVLSRPVKPRIPTSDGICRILSEGAALS